MFLGLVHTFQATTVSFSSSADANYCSVNCLFSDEP